MKKSHRDRPSIRRRVLRALLWSLQEFTYRGRAILAALILLACLAVVTLSAWRAWSPSIGVQAEYLVTARQIELSSPPEWLQTDIPQQALENAGLSGNISLLDDELVPRLVEGLHLHPWIRSVVRLEKQYPARIRADVEYRVPIAAVEAQSATKVQLCPIDIDHVRLPARDLPQDMLVRLPRIADVGQLPLIGQPFEGQRLAGAVALVQHLGDEWEIFHLLRVIPSDRPEIRGDDRFYLYELVASGGTRIQWGAAPGQGPADESPADEKSRRLRTYVTENNNLETIHSPQRIDVRGELKVTPRVAAQPAERSS